LKAVKLLEFISDSSILIKMKRNILLTVGAAALVGSLCLMVISNQTEGCPVVELQENFDVSKYVGSWYEHARDSTIRFERGNC
jgi:lipocalin